MSHDPEEITNIVRAIVTRTLGSRGERVVVGEEAVRQMPFGSTQIIPSKAIITPLARQVAQERQISFVDDSSDLGPQAIEPKISGLASSSLSPGSENKNVAVGSDHGGFALKESIKIWLVEGGYQVIDCGTNSQDSVDYPDFAFSVAQYVAGGQAWRGIIVDGAGIGSCMVANKVPLGQQCAMIRQLPLIVVNTTTLIY
jgi:hypothetical protein